MSAPLVVGAVCARPGCGHGEDLHDGICFGTACECVRFVAVAGALPMPVAPEPQALSAAEVRLSQYGEQRRTYGNSSEKALHQIALDLCKELSDQRQYEKRLREQHDLDVAEINRLRAERAKYVGKEPTIAEEMAYLSRCIDSVLAFCDEQDKAARLFDLPQPEWIAKVREAAEGMVERTSYPPALPWARLMDDDDRAMFLDELAESATVHASSDVVLDGVEETCATWRLIAEAQHGHNTAPGPDRMTASFAPVASLREPEGEHYPTVHHSYRLGHDLPETGGTR